MEKTNEKASPVVRPRYMQKIPLFLEGLNNLAFHVKKDKDWEDSESEKTSF